MQWPCLKKNVYADSQKTGCSSVLKDKILHHGIWKNYYISCLNTLFTYLFVN